MFLPALVDYLKLRSMVYKCSASLEVTMCLPSLRESLGFLAAVVYN